MRGERDFEALFLPTATSSLDGVTVTRSVLLLTVLDKVKNRLLELRREHGAWLRREVTTPGIGTLGVSALDEIESDDYFLTVTDFLTPTTLYLGHAGSDARERLKAMPAWFDPAPYTVSPVRGALEGRHDGAVFRRHGEACGIRRQESDRPVWLRRLRGLFDALYSGMIGAGWLEQGRRVRAGQYPRRRRVRPALAPGASRKTASAPSTTSLRWPKDLIRRKVTSPRHLGIMGGSNGGLLVGAALTQRPDLFNAVVCQVPLLDMRRYHKLLAGASWMGEYGDPDDPAQWEFIGKYSPYQNVFKDKHYPRVLFTTSTRDDRVHPGHARKMAALMESAGTRGAVLGKYGGRACRRGQQHAAGAHVGADLFFPAQAAEMSGMTTIYTSDAAVRPLAAHEWQLYRALRCARWPMPRRPSAAPWPRKKSGPTRTGPGACTWARPGRDRPLVAERTVRRPAWPGPRPPLTMPRWSTCSRCGSRPRRAVTVAAALLDATLAWARASGARAMQLGVVCGNDAARRLYERAGFRAVGDPEPQRPGSSRMEQRMRLALA
jgi:dienelactone hydrolase